MQIFYYSLSLFLIVVLAKDCGRQEKQAHTQEKLVVSKIRTTKTPLETNVASCPEDGKCSAILKPNTTFSLAEDSIDALYPVWDEKSSEYASFVFKYERDKNPNYADNEYREEIFFTFNPERDYKLKDSNLQQVKLTYGRICFCRGATGYVPVTQGQLEIRKIDSENYRIALQFKNEAYPQLIQSIEDTLYLPTQN